MYIEDEILKGLIKADIIRVISYFDLFDYPLTINQIIRFSKYSPEQISKTLQELININVIKNQSDYYYLNVREWTVQARQLKEQEFNKIKFKVRLCGWLLSNIPFVKGIIITGSISKEIFSKYDDFDFLVVVKKNHLWVCRTLIQLLKKLVSFNYRNNNYKYFCCNYFLDEENLEINEKNEFIAIEIATSIPLFNRRIYDAYFDKNNWIKNCYPNVSINNKIVSIPPQIPLIKLFFEIIIRMINIVIRILDNTNSLEKIIYSNLYKRWKKRGHISNEDEWKQWVDLKRIKTEPGKRSKFLSDLYNDNDKTNIGLFYLKAQLKKLSPQNNTTNKRCDILFTHAYYLNNSKKDKKTMKPYVPLGPLYVASYLREKGYIVNFYDTCFQTSINDFRKFLKNNDPPIVGIYIFEPTKQNALKMIDIAKHNGSIVIAGGPEPSLKPQYYIEQGADFVVVGEGEETTFELIDAIYNKSKKPEEIPGVFSKTGYKDKHSILNMDELSLPAYDLVNYKPYFDSWENHHNTSSIHFGASRGCPYNCTWCCKPVFGSNYRVTSPKKFVNEIKFLNDNYNPGQFWFYDDIFGLNKKWLKEFRNETISQNIQIKYECLQRVDLIDEETISYLKDTGCIQLWLGAESGSQRVLSQMEKNFNVDDTLIAAAIIHKSGIKIGFFIMLGYLNENIHDLELTRKLLIQTLPDNLGISIAEPLEGTQFYNLVNENHTPFKFIIQNSAFRIKKKYKPKYPKLFYSLFIRLVLKEIFIAKHSLARQAYLNNNNSALYILPHKIKLMIYKTLYSILKNVLPK
ncbi:MAG: radical SAM protein [FCB group bacterium]|jgi:radical SAM superfamily enzyme YgiQ (UPF0313 family)